MTTLRTTALLLALVTVTGHGPAQRPGETTSTAKPGALHELLAAGDAERQAALIDYIQQQIATGAIYAGQFAGLRPIAAKVVPLLRRWILEAPAAVKQGDPFRVACVRVLRDILGHEAPPELAKTLTEIAQDDYETNDMRSEAMFALADFGDTSLVDKVLTRWKKVAASENAAHRASAHYALAQIYYGLRRYADAAASYEAFLKLCEDGVVQTTQGLPTAYYNCACSLALAGKTDKALQYVEKALALGEKLGQPIPRQLLETDMDIASLRTDPRLAKLIEHHYGTVEPPRGNSEKGK